MDGTLYRGTEAFPGIENFIRELRSRVSWVYFLSNNSSKSRRDYQARLSGLGIDATEDEILLSTDALCAVLKKKEIASAHVVGTEALVQALRAEGIETAGGAPEAVVVGFDTELTYAKLRTACLLLRDPAVAYLATHADRVCPTEAGDIPDAGSIIALIETATGRLPQVTCGKPNPEMVEHVFARHAVDGSQSVFFGDRVYTDYEMARNCGALFVGVLSGEATRGDYEDCHNIVVMPSVSDVFAQPAPAADARSPSA
jgi:HAD superfamily hydrolase (TIGR01450 family)